LASDEQFWNPQGGLGIGDGNALTFLSAGANAKTEVNADPVDLFQDLGPVSREDRSRTGSPTAPFSIR